MPDDLPAGWDIFHDRCERCATVRRRTLNAFGGVWRLQYAHPDGWVTHEGGIDRNALRLELAGQLKQQAPTGRRLRAVS